MNDQCSEIQPCQNKHAIEEIVFALKFISPLSEEHLKIIASLRENETIKSNFPRCSERIGQIVNVEFDEDKLSKVPGSLIRKLDAVVYERIKPNGLIEKAININGDRISAHLFLYTRWSEVWPIAKKFLKITSNQINDLNIVMVALNVRDLFIYDGPPQDFDPSSLFRQGSKYLNSNVFQIKELWHCHHGFLEDSSNDAISKMLNVTNISTELAGERKLNIRIDCFFEARMNLPGITAQEMFGKDVLFIDGLMNNMHEKNKEILSDIIVDEMANRITLEVKK